VTDVLTLAPPDSGRWTPQRKEAVVLAIRRREVGVAQACAALGLDQTEVETWLKDFEQHGRPGLAVMRLQDCGRRHAAPTARRSKGAKA
jgi:transposase-like protein